jgi:hypothetical protein
MDTLLYRVTRYRGITIGREKTIALYCGYDHLDASRIFHESLAADGWSDCDHGQETTWEVFRVSDNPLRPTEANPILSWCPLEEERLADRETRTMIRENKRKRGELWLQRLKRIFQLQVKGS